MSDRIFQQPSYELIPLAGIEQKAEAIPIGSRISVIASPTKGMGPTLDLAANLHKLGYAVAPHVSAHLVQDLAELNEIIDRLAGEGIDRVFVVGGDGLERGKFRDALDLLRAMDDLGHHFTEVGIAGYPEGHPFIAGDALREALIAKQRHATYLSTQMCFDAEAIATWARGTRNDGVRLPIRVGIPGVVDPIKLASIAGRIGVGTSVRYLLKNRRAVWRLLRPGAYKPTRLVNSLASRTEELGISGLHIFTFNQVEATVDWIKKQS